MLAELKRDALEANLALARQGLVHLTFGNASSLDRGRGIFAIKPSGVAYISLQAEHMVLVDLEGKVVEGGLNPSSDTETHRRVYLGFPKIGGVVHTHSACATAYAQAGKPIAMAGTTHADYFAGDVPVTRRLSAEEIAGRYEWETGGVILERFAAIDPQEIPAVLVNQHGPFTWGPTAASAVETAAALEFVAHLAFMTETIASQGARIGPELQRRHFNRKHGPGATYGQK